MLCQHEGHDCGASSCIHRIPIFESLTEEEVNALSPVIHTHHYKKGEIIFREGEPAFSLYFVNDGVIKISKLSDEGKEQIFRILFSGDFFGQFALLQNRNHYANAEVIETATVCQINSEDFKKAMEHNPEMAFRFILAISEKLRESDEWMGTISLLEVERRLAKALLIFHKKSQAGDKPFQLPVSKKEFASLIGTTPETLSRRLAYFESLNLLVLEDRKHIRIIDSEGLEQITGTWSSE